MEEKGISMKREESNIGIFKGVAGDNFFNNEASVIVFADQPTLNPFHTS